MWTIGLRGGPRRVNHAAARVGDYIYSFGGYNSVEVLNDWDPIQVFILNTKTFRWTPGPLYTVNTSPYHRYGHSVVSFGAKIYLWGGRNNSEGFYTVSCFNTATLTWENVQSTGTEPLAKDGHSACIINNKMYIFGGFEFITNQYSQDTHCLDLLTFEWSLIRAKGHIPCQRDFHTAIAVDHYMYVFGGRGDLMETDYESEIYCQNVYRFDTLSETWECLTTNGEIPCGRRSHSAWYYNDYMYIFGGYNSTMKQHFNDLYRFSLKTNTWQLVKVPGQYPCERRRQFCIMHIDKMFLFGGTSPTFSNQTYINDEKTRDNNDLYVLDMNVSLRTLCILQVIAHKLDTSYLPNSIQCDVYLMSTPNIISNENGYSSEEENYTTDND